MMPTILTGQRCFATTR